METKKQTKLKKFFSVLGPGFITGAADDDPSGIVTYSQAGAQFGLGQLWTIFITIPLMIAVQEACGRIGIVTRKGLAQIIKENYSRKVLYFLVFLLLAANTINLGTDIGAMAAVSQLFFKIPFAALALGFGIVIVGLEIILPYRKYARVLKWLTISLFAYFITGLIVGGDWSHILKATFVPSFRFDAGYLLMIVGIVGTTISPYLFFWQTSQEVEEQEDHMLSTHRMPRSSKTYIANMRLDTIIGMVFSNLTAWFIIVTAAQVLHTHNITDIQSAAEAAQALQPLVQSFPHSGTIAQLLFALGIIGTGLLAIPIFAAASSYAIAEIFSWREGLNNKFNQAKGFYGVIIAGTVVGLLINFIGVNPIKALVYTAVLNGVIAVPLILMIVLIGNNKKIMGKYTSGLWSNVFAALAFLGMSAAAAFMIYTFFA